MAWPFLLISSELEEILALANRIAVIFDGRNRRRDGPCRCHPRPTWAAHGWGQRGSCIEVAETAVAVDTGREPEPQSPRRRTGVSEVVALYAVSFGVALLLSAVLIAATGGSWSQVFTALLDGSFRSPGRWGTTLTFAAPMLLVALGMIIGLKAGLVNIGQEGQLLIGAAFAAFVITRYPDAPGVPFLILGLVASAVGGGIWAGIAAVLKYWRGVPEVVSTLLLIFIAFQINGYSITRVFVLKDPDPNRPNRNPTSAEVPAGQPAPRDRDIRQQLLDQRAHCGWVRGRGWFRVGPHGVGAAPAHAGP